MSLENAISLFIAAAQEKYAVSIWVHENIQGHLILDWIVVDSSSRGGGVGTQVMGELVQFADLNQKVLALTPSNAFGGSVGRLVKFFRKFGFVRNSGRNKDFAISDTFLRIPKS
jgi:GNAT superfamily N-acetyltransferase